MSVYQRKGSDRAPRWWIQFHARAPDGQKVTVRRPARVNTRKAAEAEERDLRHEIETAGKARAAGQTLFGVVARDFLDAVRGTVKEDTTFESYSDHLRLHLRPAFETRPIAAVKGTEITRFRAALLGKPKELSPGTVNSVLRTLRRVLRWAHKNEFLPSVPAIEFLKVPKVEREILTPERIETFLASARVHEPRWFPLYLAMARLGLRVGEAQALKGSDRMGPLLHIQRRVYKGKIDEPKGNRDRWLPIPPDLLAVLEALPAKGWLFPNDDGGPAAYSTLRDAIERTCERVGFRETAHGFRHAFCSNLANVVGAKPRQVQILAGHATLATTEGYFHGVPEGLADLVTTLAGSGTVAVPCGSRPEGTGTDRAGLTKT